MLKVTGGIRELREEDQLLLLQNRVCLEKLEQGTEFIILVRGDVRQMFQELRELVEVLEAIVQDGVNIKQVRVEPFNQVEDVLGQELLLLILFRHVLTFGIIRPELILMLLHITEEGGMAKLPAFETGLIAF